MVAPRTTMTIAGRMKAGTARLLHMGSPVKENPPFLPSPAVCIFTTALRKSPWARLPYEVAPFAPTGDHLALVWREVSVRW